MKKIVLLTLVFFLGLTTFAQKERNPDISVDRYYHIKRGVVWFHAMGKNFQPINMGEVKTDQILIYNSSEEDVSFSWDELPAGYSIKVEPEVIPPKGEAIIYITLDSEKTGKYGPQLSYFHINSSVKGERPYRLLMSPNIMEDFSALSDEDYAKAPVIEFDKTVSQFDTLPQMSQHDDVFVVKNVGKSDLYIRNVKAGCGCTHTNTSKDTLKPGETAELSFEYRTLHKRGPQNSKITVVSNDPKSPQSTLYIKGLVTKLEEEK